MVLIWFICIQLIMKHFKNKIVQERLLTARKYAMELKHPAFNFIQAQSYEYMSEFAANITRKFNKILVHGIYPDLMLKHLGKSIPQIHLLGQLNSSQNLVTNARSITQQAAINQKYDAIFSSLQIHFDLQKQLRQYNRMLEADGALIGSIWTEKCLQNLKIAYLLAENQRSGGMSPKVYNFYSMGYLGHVLTTQKFNMPTIMAQNIEVQMDSVVDLLTLLQISGQSGFLYGRRKGVYKDLLLAMSAIYDTQNLEPGQELIRTVFEMGIFIGWKQDKNQPKPLRRGSQINQDFFDKLKQQDPDLKTFRIIEGVDQPQETK